MKNFILIIFALLVTHSLIGQDENEERYLNISGIATTSVMPDTYTLLFGLEEYFEEDEKGTRKLKTLDDILVELKEKLSQFGLEDTKPALFNVSSINQNGYGTGNQMYLRKSYGVINVTKDYSLLLDLVENLRFKGLSGIFISGEFSDPASLQTKICNEAIDDAIVHADEIFKKLDLTKGNILQININNDNYNYNIRNNNNNYGNQNAFGQFSFSMVPSNIQCSVSIRFEIKRE